MLTEHTRGRRVADVLCPHAPERLGGYVVAQEAAAVQVAQDVLHLRDARRGDVAAYVVLRVEGRVGEDGREVDRLERLELVDRPPEVGHRGVCEPVDLRAPLHEVEVELEQARLGDVTLDLPREEGLLQLPRDRPLVLEEEVLHELLCDRAPAADDPPLREVGLHGARDRALVEAGVAPERVVLGGEEREVGVRRQLAEGHPRTLGRTKRATHLGPVTSIVNARSWSPARPWGSGRGALVDEREVDARLLRAVAVEREGEVEPMAPSARSPSRRAAVGQRGDERVASCAGMLPRAELDTLRVRPAAP